MLSLRPFASMWISCLICTILQYDIELHPHQTKNALIKLVYDGNMSDFLRKDNMIFPNQLHLDVHLMQLDILITAFIHWHPQCLNTLAFETLKWPNMTAHLELRDEGTNDRDLSVENERQREVVVNVSILSAIYTFAQHF